MDKIWHHLNDTDGVPVARCSMGPAESGSVR